MIRTNSRYFVNKNDLSTFFLDAYANYTVPVPSATEDFTRSGLRSESTANLKWRHKKFSITPAIGLGLFIADNRFSNAAQVNHYFSFFLPALEIAQGAFSLNYQTSFQEPNMLNLQPVPNNTNPLYIRYGNPQLKPAYNSSFSFNARKYDTQRSLTYNASVNTTFIDNATIVSRTVNSTGLQTSTPVNANGTRNITGSFLVQKDWKLQGNKQFSFLLSGSSGIDQTLVLLNGEQSKAWVYNIKPSAELRMNLNDQVEVTQSYTFTNFRSTYQSSAFNGLMFNVHDSKSEVIYRPGKFVLESTLDYRYNGNQVPGLLKSYYKWNAAVTYLFLRGNRGQLKLSANDILDQNVLAQRIIAENLVGDIQGSTIRRYGLLTFTYNIRNFGEKVGGRNKLF